MTVSAPGLGSKQLVQAQPEPGDRRFQAGTRTPTPTPPVPTEREAASGDTHRNLAKTLFCAEETQPVLPAPARSRLRPSPLWCLLPRHSALWSVLGQPSPRQQGPLLKQQTPTSHSSGGWGLRSGWRGARFGGGGRCCRWDGCLRALCSLGGQPASSVSLLIRAPTPRIRAPP